MKKTYKNVHKATQMILRQWWRHPCALADWVAHSCVRISCLVLSTFLYCVCICSGPRDQFDKWFQCLCMAVAFGAVLRGVGLEKSNLQTAMTPPRLWGLLGGAIVAPGLYECLCMVFACSGPHTISCTSILNGFVWFLLLEQSHNANTIQTIWWDSKHWPCCGATQAARAPQSSQDQLF